MEITPFTTDQVERAIRAAETQILSYTRQDATCLRQALSISENRNDYMDHLKALLINLAANAS